MVPNHRSISWWDLITSSPCGSNIHTRLIEVLQDKLKILLSPCFLKHCESLPSILGWHKPQSKKHVSILLELTIVQISPGFVPFFIVLAVHSYTVEHSGNPSTALSDKRKMNRENESLLCWINADYSSSKCASSLKWWIGLERQRYLNTNLPMHGKSDLLLPLRKEFSVIFDFGNMSVRANVIGEKDIFG